MQESIIPMSKTKLQVMESTLNSAVDHKNTLTVKEFSRYQLLFTKDGHKRMTEDRYIELCKNWQNRVSLFYPVKIIDHEGVDCKVVLTLPPVFSNIDSFNEMGSVNASNVINFFHNAISKDNNLSLDSERATEAMLKCLDTVNDEARQQKKQDEFTQLEKETLVKTGNEDPESLSLTDWFS